jgi:Arc/MetJ-type ribon-helix-helix transcriptional regulator
VGTINVTVRFNEEELRRLDELAQRMGKTRSDVIRDLINRFNETLREEVEKEKKKCFTMGVVSALESIILDPTLMLRFVRRNVDILGFPDFLIGMVRVKNRVVFFSHQDKIGHQLLQLVRSKIEDEVRREEAEIEREEGGDEDSEGSRATPMRIRVGRPVKPGFVSAAPVVTNHKLVSNNGAISPAAKPAAPAMVGRLVSGNGGSGAKSTASTTAPGSKKLASEEVTASAGSPNAQPIPPNQRASTNDNSKDMQNPAGQGINHGLSGDFVIALVTQSYHKHRDRLLKLIGDMMVG